MVIVLGFIGIFEMKIIDKRVMIYDLYLFIYLFLFFKFINVI